MKKKKIKGTKEKKRTTSQLTLGGGKTTQESGKRVGETTAELEGGNAAAEDRGKPRRPLFKGDVPPESRSLRLPRADNSSPTHAPSRRVASEDTQRPSALMKV